MNENDLKALVANYKPLILGPEAEDPEAGLLYLAQEIERTTRAHAAKVAFEAANRISNRG